MAIGTLKVVHYETSNGPWSANLTVDPPWSDVESAIRRMDGDLFPIVMLFIGRELPRVDMMPGFDLLGGKNGYFISARPNGTELYYRDEKASSEEVEVWISDQGFSCSRMMVCPDIDLVLAAARHFFDT